MNKRKAIMLTKILGIALGVAAPVSAMAQDNGLIPGCNPDGPNVEQAALYNAPPAPGVVVEFKTPRHPGPVGPYRAPVLGLLGQGVLMLGTLGMGATAMRRRERKLIA